MLLMNEICSIYQRSLNNIENLDEVLTRIHIETQGILRFPCFDAHSNIECNSDDGWQEG